MQLFILCKNLYVKSKSNHILANGWDADIYIPELNLAILWNGPWHYKQMPHKNHSLEQVQNRDRIKINEFSRLGIQTIVFEDRDYTPASAFNYIRNNY